jgi:hypothetical protein
MLVVRRTGPHLTAFPENTPRIYSIQKEPACGHPFMVALDLNLDAPVS